MKRNMFENQNPQIPIPKEFRSDQPSHFYSQRTYDDMKLSKYITMVVNYLQLDRPSKIQAMSFAYIVNGTSCILADQTGSGKTLGYLLPIIQRLYSNTPMLSTSTTSCSDTTSLSNRNNRKNVEERKVLYPKVLIMAPTAELASQVSKVVRSISSVLRFRSICLTSGSHSLQDEISNLPNTATTLDDNGNPSITNVEFLIATPGRLFSSLKNGDISLAKTSAIVLDEADVLFLDESFPLQGIGRYLPESLSTDEGSVSKTQFVFVTATLPDVIAKQISREFPEAITLKGPGLHRIPPTVEEILVDCSLPPPRTSPLGGRLTARTSQRQYNEAVAEKKRVELIHALTSNSEVDRTLIFCNTIETCRFVENALIRIDRNEQIRKILGYHGAIDPRKRVDNLNEFTRRLLPLPVVLVCTDRASRGIDFNNFNVDHVILFDFPQEPSEYVRRVGRTGRAGRFGKVTILVHGRQVPIVKSLLSASKLGKRIDPIPSLNTLSSYSKQDNLQDDDES